MIPGSNARRRTDKLSLQFESNQRILSVDEVDRVGKGERKFPAGRQDIIHMPASRGLVANAKAI